MSAMGGKHWRKPRLSRHRGRRAFSRRKFCGFRSQSGPITLFVSFTEGVFAMKPTPSAFALSALLSGSLLIGTDALAQSTQATRPQQAQPSAVSDPSRPSSSNPWDSLPRMTAYRCLAEALGTASDPQTGAPLRTSVDPQTGKPLCPAAQLQSETAKTP